MSWVRTVDLTPGTRVLVGHHGLIRTVSSIELNTDVRAYTYHGEENVYTVRYVEGDTEEWPGFNWAVGWVQWPTPGRRQAPEGPGLWDEGSAIEWNPRLSTEESTSTRDQEAER